jgi:hypothetical protein
MADNAVLTQIGKGLGIGLAFGFMAALVLTVLSLPPSFMMNKIIYHTWVMRLAVGGYATVLAVFIFPVIIIMRIMGISKRAEFFGLFPVFAEMPPGKSDTWLSPFISVFMALLSPFTWNERSGNYIKAIEEGMGLMAKGAPGTVNEAFYEKARETAGNKEYDVWKKSVDDLHQMANAAEISVNAGTVGMGSPA